MKIRGAVLERTGAPRPYGESRPITVGELDLADPGPHEVLVRIEAASVCHSDLSVVDGNRVRPLPMLLGHEAAGVVLSTGDEVTDLDAGQRVILTFLPRCGECHGCRTNGIAPCERGSATNGTGEMLTGGTRLSRHGEPVLHHLGVSGFATHAVVDRRSLVPVEAAVPAPVAAVLGCAVLTGGGAVINAVHLVAGMRLAVVGLGGVGMAAILTALAHDGVEVFGVDSSPQKREQALALGVAAAYSPEEAHDALRADAVIEAVGRAVAFETAVGCTAAGGTTISVGLPAPGDTATISPLALVAEGRTIIGSYLGSSVPERDLPLFVEMWKQGRLPVERLISSTVPLDHINEAMEELAAGTQLRQVLDLTQETL
jgi:alcohol dehydrogenase